MGKVLLVIVSVLFGVVYYYREEAKKTTSPRETLAKAVEAAKGSSPRELSKDEVEVLKLQIALLNYRALKGAPPKSLSELVPEYFDAVPKNPQTGKPFEYEAQGSSWKIEDIQSASPVQTAKKVDPKAPKDGALEMGVDFINPNLMQTNTAIYDAAGKRDPFRPFDFSARTKKGAASTPLERYSLGQLRLTAVIMDPDGKNGGTAFVEDASGKGFSIKQGAKIGDRGGVVIGVEPDRLKILEVSIDITGKETQQVVEMKITTQDNPQTKKR